MNDFFKKLKAGKLEFGLREKRWTIGLVMVIIVVWGNKLVLRPRTMALSQAKAAYVEARNGLVEIEAQKPDVELRRSHIRQLQNQVGSSYGELEALEKGLLYSQDQDLLLERLVTERKKYQLQINAVEPVRDEFAQASVPTGKAAPQAIFYRQLRVKVDTSASYDNLISYVTALEREGPYQKVRGIRIEMDKEEKAQPRATILVEILLSDTSVKKSELREKVASMVEGDISARQAKDPFLAQERPREEEVITVLKLSGIFGAGKHLTALIDGSAYQEGDMLQGKKIVKIKPDCVIFEEGNKRYFLYEKQAGQ